MDDDARPDQRHELLRELLALAHDTHDRIATALDRPFEVMTAGDAWTGPTTARAFTEDIGYRRQDLPAIADDLVAEIAHELGTTPQVTG